ncbi:Hypothetical predicted protein, partial [Marmota monax]
RDRGAAAEGRGVRYVAGGGRPFRSADRPPPLRAFPAALPCSRPVRLHAAAAGAEEHIADAPAPGPARAPPRRLPLLSLSRSARRRRRRRRRRCLEPERPAAAGAGRERWDWAEARRWRRRQRWPGPPRPLVCSGREAAEETVQQRGESVRNILGSWCLDIG